MIPIAISRLSRRNLGQPPSATQEMNDYWRNEYQDYSKNLNSLWDRLRPGFTQVAPRTPTTPPTPPTTASSATITRRIEDVDQELLAQKAALTKLVEDYEREKAKLVEDQEEGWPGRPQWKKRELERDFDETLARLWDAWFRRNLVILGWIQLLLLEKETRLRQRRAAELRESEAARGPTPTPAPDTATVPNFWEELCILVRNLEIAENERKARIARGATPAAIQAAAAEVAKAVKALADGLRGRFSSLEDMGYWMAWCDEVRGVHLNWRLWITPSTLLAPVVSTPPTSSPTGAAPATPGPTATATPTATRLPYYWPGIISMTGRR
jgi:hypothetical protein